jgi:cytochrome c oxidase subunit 1
MVGGMVMAYLSGLHFWWPKITGRMYSEVLAKTSAVLIFIGFNLTFFPQFLLGYLGMPRRYHVYPEEFQILHVASTGGATVLGLGYLVLFVCLVASLVNGARAGANPWGARGLEWEIDSPPPPHNFHETPLVTSEAYAYEEDAVMRAKPQARPADPVAH